MDINRSVPLRCSYQQGYIITRGAISASEGREELHFEFSYITLLCLWFQMMAHNHLLLEHPDHDVPIIVSSLELDMEIPQVWSLLTSPSPVHSHIMSPSLCSLSECPLICILVQWTKLTNNPLKFL